MAATLTVDLNARIARFETEMKRATGTLDRFGKQGGVVAAGLKSAFATVGVIGLAAFAKSGIDAADALNDMSLRLGVSVKDLAGFKTAAEQSGTSLEGVGTGIARLTRSIGDAEGGNKKLAASLAELGVTSRDPKEAFFQLADAVQRIQDPAKRAALLSDVLGKSYQDLVPLLNEGGAALRESAKASESFADAMARLAPNADKFNDNLAELKTNAAGAAASMLAELVPALNKVFERIGLLKELIGAGGLFNSLFANTGDTSQVAQRLRKEIELTEQALEGKKGNQRAVTEDHLKTLNAQLQVVLASQIKALNAPPDTETQRLIKADRASYGIASPTPTKTTRAVTDPLESLLAGTDTAKAAEYEKLLGLLNTRFERGAIGGKQYAEALTNLRKGFFSEEIKAFNDQLEYNAETERLVAEHLKSTNDELYEQEQAWKAAGAAIENEYKTPLAKLEEQLAYLDELFRRNLISVEALGAGYAAAFDEGAEKVKTMDTFAQQAAKNIQDSMADFFFDPFSKGLDGMLAGFANMLQRMIAEAAAAELAKAMFGDSAAGGSGSGWVGAAFSAVGGFLGFADGGTHKGGLRIVGERGPELEATGPSRIYNAAQTKDMLSGNGSGGSNVTIYQNFTIETGVAQTVRAEMMNFIPMIKRETLAAVTDAKRRGGSFGAAFG